MDNPYQSPQSYVLNPRKGDDLLDDVASGQKLAIYAILLYFAAAGLQMVIGPLAYLLVLACLGMSWVGIYRISRGLGHAPWWRIVLLLLMLIPLVGLLVLVSLNARATSKLREAGYTVGLLGARNY